MKEDRAHNVKKKKKKRKRHAFTKHMVIIKCDITVACKVHSDYSAVFLRSPEFSRN